MTECLKVGDVVQTEIVELNEGEYTVTYSTSYSVDMGEFIPKIKELRSHFDGEGQRNHLWVEYKDNPEKVIVIGQNITHSGCDENEPDRHSESYTLRTIRNLRYGIVTGSESGHCCFHYTILDNHRPSEYWMNVCECFEYEDVKKVCDALNEMENG